MAEQREISRAMLIKEVFAWHFCFLGTFHQFQSQYFCLMRAGLVLCILDLVDAGWVVRNRPGSCHKLLKASPLRSTVMRTSELISQNCHQSSHTNSK